MIRDIQEMVVADKIELDLTGPDGNAFVIVGLAERLGKGLGLNSEQREDIKNEMMADDYEHLIQTFDDVFGDFVIMYR